MIYLYDILLSQDSYSYFFFIITAVRFYSLTYLFLGDFFYQIT